MTSADSFPRSTYQRVISVDEELGLGLAAALVDGRRREPVQQPGGLLVLGLHLVEGGRLAGLRELLDGLVGHLAQLEQLVRGVVGEAWGKKTVRRTFVS